MGMTMTQKIIAAHAGLPEVHAGQLVTAKVDMVLSNDITGPVAIREMRKVGMDTVFDNTKIAMIPDHFSPAKDIKSAEQCKAIRDFAKAHEIKHYYEVGKMGVEHCLLPEQGIVGAGQLIIGARQPHLHLRRSGRIFHRGMGSTDIAAAMISGETWLKVPEAIKVTVTGCANEQIRVRQRRHPLSHRYDRRRRRTLSEPGILRRRPGASFYGQPSDDRQHGHRMWREEWHLPSRRYLPCLSGERFDGEVSLTKQTPTLNTAARSPSIWQRCAHRSLSHICQATLTPSMRSTRSPSIRLSSAAAPTAVSKTCASPARSSRAKKLRHISDSSSSLAPRMSTKPA